MMAPATETVIRCITESNAHGTPWWSSPLMSGIFGLVGTGVGATLAFVLTRRSQREQWVRDRRNEEFKAVLEELNRAFHLRMRFQFGSLLSGEEERDIVESSAHVLRVIGGCIFTATELWKLRVGLRWTEAAHRYRRSGDIKMLSDLHTDLQREMVRAAGGA